MAKSERLGEFDPADPATIADPYAAYARLRADHPVVRWSGSDDVWLVSRHADVEALFAHRSARVTPVGTDVPPAYVGGPAEVMWRHNMALLEEPDHTRVRRSVARPFSRAGVEALRATVTAIVDDTVDAALAAGSIDAARDVATPIPRRVVCELLGLPDDDFDQLAAWTPDFLRIFLPDANTADDVARVHTAAGNFIDYFERLAAERERHATGDLTTQLVAAHAAGSLSRGELVATLRGVFTAGFETTMATLTSFLLCLAEDPSLIARLRRRPDLIAAAADEVLRWETPVQAVMRSFAEPVTVSGVTIPVGHKVWLLTGSANHDDTVHPDPGRFVPERYAADADPAPSPHVAFGGGRHRCAGAALARMELELAIDAIVHRVDAVRRLDTGAPARRANFQFRSIERLPVELVAAAPQHT